MERQQQNDLLGTALALLGAAAWVRHDNHNLKRSARPARDRPPTSESSTEELLSDLVGMIQDRRPVH